MNLLSMFTSNKEALNQVYNTAVGERTSLKELVKLLKEYLSKYDEKIMDVKVTYGPERIGDIPHSLASIDKARKFLDYKPRHNIAEGLRESVEWYWNHLGESVVKEEEKLID